MVNNSLFSDSSDSSAIKKPGATALVQLLLFLFALLLLAVCFNLVGRFRIGIYIFRAGMVVFNLGSFLYVLSLIGQRAWQGCGVIAARLGKAGEQDESGDPIPVVEEMALGNRN